MNEEFDQSAGKASQSGARACLCLAVTLQLVRVTWAADLYVDAGATTSGDGSSSNPYARITDSLDRARNLRQGALISPDETIVVHVAPGVYLGSKEPSVLAQNPRCEVLPLLLNVPNLELRGSTAVTTDAHGLPTGLDPGTETLLATQDHYNDLGKSLVLISRTTDGMAGDDVAVSGFHLDYLAVGSGSGVILDRVSNVAIRGNLITRAGLGIYAASSVGNLKGNLVSGSTASGVVAKGGSHLHPAQYLIAGNRSVSNARAGILLVATGTSGSLDVGANTLALESTSSSDERDDPPVINDATVTGNDSSGNGIAGLRLFIYRVLKPFTALLNAEPLNPRLTVTASDNTLDANGSYGLIIDANEPLRSINRPLTGAVFAQFGNNVLAANSRGPALFSFTDYGVSVGTDSLKDYKYLQEATYQIADLDGELSGFDYDNPVTDPFDGTVLNNTLIINGVVIPPGTKISPAAP